MFICNKLKECGLELVRKRNFSTLEGTRRSAAISEIDSKTKACNTRLAPIAVKDAAEKALGVLKVKGYTIKQGDEDKARLDEKSFAVINKALSGKLKKTTTISGSTAWSVKLPDKRATHVGKWELKIYQHAQNDYRITVGYVTQSFAHYWDALLWLSGKSPNGDNAEAYLEMEYYDTTSHAALKNFRKLGGCKELVVIRRPEGKKTLWWHSSIS